MAKAPKKRISRNGDERAVIQQNDEGPRPVATEATPKTTEEPMLYIGPGFVGGTVANAELERRIPVAVSERGGYLTKNTTGPTYGVVSALNGTDLVAAGSSLATIKAYAAVADPSIE